MAGLDLPRRYLRSDTGRLLTESVVAVSLSRRCRCRCVSEGSTARQAKTRRTEARVTLEATNHANGLLRLHRTLQSGILSGKLLVERLRRRAEVLRGVLGPAEGTSTRAGEGEGVTDVD